MSKTYMTYMDKNALLKTAISLYGRSTKAIAESINISPYTLYKWKTGGSNLSPHTADRLLMYFVQNEPDRLALAESILTG